MPDLTPFGFTPTESAAYGALVRHGALSGYALARALSIARANAYQALEGLVAKGLVRRQAGRPNLYRALDPQAAFAKIAGHQAELLDRLEQQLRRQEPGGEPAIVELTGRRAVLDLSLKTAAKSPDPVRCLAPLDFLAALAPAWNKRKAESLSTELWAAGEPADTRGLAISGWVSPERLAGYLGHADAGILLCGRAAIVATLNPGQTAAYWITLPFIAGLCAATFHLLTQNEPAASSPG
ncbi:hypothetical protein HRbin33_01014 [bacterium HR33]|nr:hypothetical protein HRbin33_01014 [bacterium HR33]